MIKIFYDFFIYFFMRLTIAPISCAQVYYKLKLFLIIDILSALYFCFFMRMIIVLISYVQTCYKLKLFVIIDFSCFIKSGTVLKLQN